VPVKRLIRIAIFTFIILVLFALLPQDFVQISSPIRSVMGTFAQITVVAPNESIAQKAIAEAFDRLKQIETLMSAKLEGSQISKVNSLAASEPVIVSNETFYVLQKATEFAQYTNSAFDITVAPVIELWKKAADTNQPPTDQQLKTAKELTGYDKMKLNPADKSVAFTQKGVKIDLGGIAKGYAIDQAVEVLKDSGAIAGLVDIGGDIRSFGKPIGGKKNWLIALQNPDLKNSNQQLLKLKLNDHAVATSGNYQRFYDVQGRRQSHIIDSATASGAKTLSSATVIANSALAADAFATAVSVLGSQRGLSLINSFQDTEAITISPAPDFKIVATEGAAEFMEQPMREVKTQMYKQYVIHKTKNPPKLKGDWDSIVWGQVSPLDIALFIGEEPEHKPKTQAKLLYDDECLYVIWRVEDNYVRAVKENLHDAVYLDSCVEFFFTPGADISDGYFNLEINCGGTFLFHHQLKRETEVVELAESDCAKIEIYHSQPKIVEPEKTEPTTWVVEYKIPFDILEGYADVKKAALGVIWYANFYKCGDRTSHPHWLTWSLVDKPELTFHKPTCFGTILFE